MELSIKNNMQKHVTHYSDKTLIFCYDFHCLWKGISDTKGNTSGKLVNDAGKTYISRGFIREHGKLQLFALILRNSNLKSYPHIIINIDYMFICQTSLSPPI